jgi:hypothetical protein
MLIVAPGAEGYMFSMAPVSKALARKMTCRAHSGRSLAEPACSIRPATSRNLVSSTLAAAHASNPATYEYDFTLSSNLSGFVFDGSSPVGKIEDPRPFPDGGLLSQRLAASLAFLRQCACCCGLRSFACPSVAENCAGCFRGFAACLLVITCHVDLPPLSLACSLEWQVRDSECKCVYLPPLTPSDC